jgi:hypothetical protein
MEEENWRQKSRACGSERVPNARSSFIKLPTRIEEITLLSLDG